MKSDLAFFDLLPNELWAIVISFLPRTSRQNFAKLRGFQELIDKISELEDKKLYLTLKSGNRMRWQRVKIQSALMQPRLKHGAVNCEDKIFIYGGASSNQPSSGLYNDLWMYTDEDNFRRLNTSTFFPPSTSFPSPKCNFGYTKLNNKVFVVGGRSISTSDQPYSSMHSTFEIHSLNTDSGQWHKIQSTGGTEPQFSSGIRCVMLTSTELLVVSGLVPTFYNQEINFEENFNHRTSMQVFVMKFCDESHERGFWYRVADIQNVRGNLMPIPRVEMHLVGLGNDAVFMYGGRAISNSLQDAWIMKITRPNYSIRWHQITIENPLAPSLPSHSFPSCLVNDLLVFTGVRTSLLKKPEVKKVKNPHPQQPSPPQSKPIYEPRRIFINQERPLNTIGAMAAFSVPPVVPLPQKVIRIQPSPEPQPQPPRRIAQDYPMRIYCLDLSNIFNVDDDKLKRRLSIRWLPLRRDGLFCNAPELRAFATFTRLDNGIALIGGVKRIQCEDEEISYEATNEVFMLKYDEI